MMAFFKKKLVKLEGKESCDVLELSTLGNISLFEAFLMEWVSSKKFFLLGVWEDFCLPDVWIAKFVHIYKL